MWIVFRPSLYDIVKVNLALALGLFDVIIPKAGDMYQGYGLAMVVAYGLYTHMCT